MGPWQGSSWGALLQIWLVARIMKQFISPSLHIFDDFIIKNGNF